MAFLTFNFESRYLNGNTEIGMILPECSRRMEAAEFYRPGKKYRVLWLLHGGRGDYSDWIRKSMIEVYACEHDLVVIMPSAMNSAYTDWPSFSVGYDMYGFFLKELMKMVYSWFPVSDRREDNYIAGLFMGGWGAGKFAVNNPELFAGAAILSSTVRNYDFMFEEKSPEVCLQYGNLIRNSGGLEAFHESLDYCTRGILQKTVEEGKKKNLPKLFIGYGDEDHHREEFEDFVDFCRKIKLPFELKIYSGYGHEWRMWDLGIQDALSFFGFGMLEHREIN